MLKKIALGVAAASVLAVPAAAAPYGHGNFNGRGQIERVNNSRQFGEFGQFGNFRQQAPRFRVGQRFDHRYAGNYRVINNPRSYRLHDAPRGYRWVQSGNDAVLVAVASGLIGALIANAF